MTRPKLPLAALSLVAACLGGDSDRPVGSRCEDGAECEGDLLCRYGRCRAECLFDRDCDPGQVCLSSGGGAGGVCTIGEEGAGGAGPCAEGLVRGPEGICRVACSPGGECPEGLVCRGGLCLDPCNGPTVLQDDFSLSEAGRHWISWPEGSEALARRDGRLVITPPAAMAASGQWGYSATFAIDLRGSWVAVEVDSSLARDAEELEAFLLLDSTGGTRLGITEEAGSLYVGRGGGPTRPSGATRPTGEPTRRWWRMREDDGEVLWEIRQDDAGWEEIWRETVPSEVTSAMWISLGVRSPGGVTAPGQVAFDNVNLDTPLRAPSLHCPATSLSDSFDDGVIASTWATDGPEGCGEERGGAFHLSGLTEAGGEACRVSTAHSYDIRDDSVTVRFTAPPFVTSGYSFFIGLWDGRPDGVWMALAEDGLWLSARGVASLRADSYGDHPYWRIRHVEGAYAFDLSADGERWEEVGALESDVDPSAVSVIVGVEPVTAGAEYDIGLAAYNRD